MSDRVLVLWCPDWPVRAALLAHPSTGPDAPVALIRTGLVFACSAAARQAGVRRGLRVREAQARCPGLAALPYDETTDARLFEPVLAAVERAAPGVQPIRPGMLALRARGPARFYGGEAEAAAVLIERAGEHGAADTRAGIADGLFAAQLAARLARPVRIVPPGESPAFLAAQPVEVVGDAAFAGLCRRLGVATLGALAAFSAADLATRFGELGSRVAALVAGSDADRVVPRSPARPLDRAIDFEEPLALVDQVAFAVRRTADEVMAALAAERLVCTAVTVTIEAGEHVSSRTWLHPRWFTAVDLVDRVRWQLQGAELDEPVTRVVLAPESVDAAWHHEEGLWGDAPDERVHHALSRVQSMLGHDAVATAVLGGGRLAAERQVLVPWGDRPGAGLAERARQPWPGSLPDPLPATVFDSPVPAAVLAGDGGVVGVTDRGLLTAEPEALRIGTGVRPLTGWSGPWPVAERWWDEASARAAHRVGVVDDAGTAWLLLLEDGSWAAEARYD